MENKKINVLVEKAVNLKMGESLGSFTGALQTAAKEHLKGKLNLPGPPAGKLYPDWSIWVNEIFSKMIVVELYQDGKSARNFAFSYDRDAKTEKFTFGDTTEVERVVSWRAKPGMTITKRKTSGDTYFDKRPESVCKSLAGGAWYKLQVA